MIALALGYAVFTALVLLVVAANYGVQHPATTYTRTTLGFASPISFRPSPAFRVHTALEIGRGLAIDAPAHVRVAVEPLPRETTVQRPIALPRAPREPNRHEKRRAAALERGRR